MSQAKSTSVADVYKGVVNDVIDGVREAFQEEGLDEQVLQELKQLWENKLKLSKAIDGLMSESPLGSSTTATRMPPPAHSHHQTRTLHPTQQLILNNNSPNHSNNNSITSLSPSQLQQLTNLQAQAGSVLNLGPSHLVNAHLAGQSTSQSLNPVLLQHLNNLNALGGASFIQSQNNIIFGLSDQPIATNATPQNGVTIDNAGTHNIVQLDGLDDSSSDDEDDDVKHDDDNDDANEASAQNGEEVEDDPLNSGDDDPNEDDTQDLFDVDNVVVCQFDKINRSKAKWKFHLKDGIMNLKGKDFVFQKAVGEAEF
ncbi:hypothetical protein HELRODRAFT_185403 [Helobdella robusta]|uniref:Transcription initiation factor IIA subunit 1 n=1 Tax=Helobdella robusta TaxID=6412 RepID=T1FMR7_HELRO|nr:hypothetical protein HELRODRAFT_185403 [Helobdella robusta]ESO08608.1 hypothetical protein HELRODRAFT_185403 [Helobdella robusta]